MTARSVLSSSRLEPSTAGVWRRAGVSRWVGVSWRAVLRSLQVVASAGVLLAAGCDSTEPEAKPKGCPPGHETTVTGCACIGGLDENGDGLCDGDKVDWSANAKLPASGERRDLYGLGSKLTAVAQEGLGYTHAWPVTVSGVLLPWEPMAYVFDATATDDSRLTAQDLARTMLGFGNLSEMYNWLGLQPRSADPEAFAGVPWPASIPEGTYVGAGHVQVAEGKALTFSCATCHTGRVFGKTVFGLTNRQTRANSFFGLGKKFFPLITPDIFKSLSGANEAEVALLLRAQKNLPAIGYKDPQAQGLDTSLAQVALSLARRQPDAWATRDPALEQTPRPNALEVDVVDSKPAVWWTMKYKTRWLSDGSIVSGNPVFTNFLWNELGRGTDLHELRDWIAANRRVMEALTAVIFATPAPRWEQIFPQWPIDEAKAKEGEALFAQHCASCHGSYKKGWSAKNAASLTASERTATTKVSYHKQTPVHDVGTDMARAKGMAAFADDLNRLEISKEMQTVVEVQNGYVPPPLEGIFLRYPYLHNQSVPSLCELLRPKAFRSPVFWMGPDVDPNTDYDKDCVGLPVGDQAPAAWQADAYAKMDTARPGLSNQGHDSFLVDADGNELLSAAQRTALIEFLKTL